MAMSTPLEANRGMERPQEEERGTREKIRDTDGIKIVLRDAIEEDRPRTRSVRWSAGWAEPPNQHQVWQEADSDIWVSRHYYREFVAEVGGVIAARVGLEAFRPPFAELCDLVVRPEFRRRGLGRLLTLQCLEEAAKRDFVAVFLQTELENIASHRLYRSLGFVPVARGRMLRMVYFLNYPLLSSFRDSYPLNQYSCSAVEGKRRRWELEWTDFVTEDYLRLTLEGGASQFDSEGMGPTLPAFDWKSHKGSRGLSVSVEREERKDIEPGDYVELNLTATNHGKQKEAGIFQMILPSGVRVSSPRTNQKRAFEWELPPGESLTQPVEIQIEANFDTSPLWFLNYPSLPVSVEVYWEGQRALLSTSLAMAAPPPQE